MGIQFLPGLGPQNSDIAAAVAAPSAATIAAAVAAPSAATIAAAVAAPSAATIAAAVAAPSAATIATQVAASVPTLSQINTSVANNASPFGGTWTAITTSGTLTNAVSFTDISSLGGYKRLRFVFWNLRQVGSNLFHYRINGTSSGYTTYGFYHSGFDAAWPTGAQDGSSIMDGTSFVGSSSDQSSSHIIDIYNADSTTSYKYCEFFGYGTKSSYINTPGPIYGRAIFKNTAAVTSLRVANSGSGFNQGNYAVFGGN